MIFDCEFSPGKILGLQMGFNLAITLGILERTMAFQML